MATYDGIFHVIDGKRKPTTRVGRVGRAARDRLRALALRWLQLACRLRELAGRLERLGRNDFGRTADDLRALAGRLDRLARWAGTLVRDDLGRTARDVTNLARKLEYLARDAASYAQRLQIQARDECSRTARHLAYLAVTGAQLVRDGLKRAAHHLQALANDLQKLLREDFHRTAGDLTRLASRVGVLARNDFDRTTRDLARLADTLARLARDGFTRTLDHLQRISVFSMAVARRAALTVVRLWRQASRLLRKLAASLDEAAGLLKVRARIELARLADLARTLAALPGELFDRLHRGARRVMVRIGLEIRRTGGQLARAGSEVKQHASAGCRSVADGVMNLAGLSMRLAHHAAGRGRHRYGALANYLERRAEIGRQADQQRASLKAAQRRTKLELAERQSMLKMAERQAKLDSAEQRARAMLAEQEAKAKVAKEEKEAAVARRTAEQASAMSARRAQEAASVDRPQEKPAERSRRILILVENLPSPFDRRVWQEANALRDAGYLVSIICPTGKGYEKKFEDIGGIHIWRYDLPFEANGALGYLAEYATAIARTWILAWRVFFGRGFDAIQACNPPDLLFLIGAFFKLFGKKFVFDHHDINPELYEAKFGRRDFFYRLLIRFERWSFGAADVSIATNESYRRIAIERGGMPPERVFVVRSGPSLERMKIVPPDEGLKRGRRYLVGYVGVMGKQEGIDCLLRAVRLIVCRYGRTDIHFGLVGGGTSLEEMKTLAERLGIAEYVTFTGRVPDAEMLAMLNTADVCVNPDVASEMNDKSTMNKIMEYMALGKPIVQFDLTEGRWSARGAALNARRDDTADFAKRILELIDNPELRARMGAAGRERVVNVLSWDHEVPRLLAAYERLWQGGDTGAAQKADETIVTFATPSAAPPAGTP